MEYFILSNFTKGDLLMEYYMVTASHIKTSKGVINSRNIYEKMMENRCWEFTTKARLFKNFKKGDCLIFYLAGYGEKQFVGSAEVEAPAYFKTSNDIPILDSKLNINNLIYRILLCNIKTWEKGKPLQQVAEKLSFINSTKLKLDRRCLGIYIRNSIKKLTEEDYKTLTEE